MHSLNITRCIKHGVKHKVHLDELYVSQIKQIKQIDSHKICTTLARTQARKRVCHCQLRHQSATAPSCATHAVDAVGAYRCHERWSHTHVAE